MAYVTHEDICKCFKDDTLLAVQAPSGTQLEVPIPDAVNKTVFLTICCECLVSGVIKQYVYFFSTIYT